MPGRERPVSQLPSQPGVALDECWCNRSNYPADERLLIALKILQNVCDEWLEVIGAEPDHGSNCACCGCEDVRSLRCIANHFRSACENDLVGSYFWDSEDDLILVGPSGPAFYWEDSDNRIRWSLAYREPKQEAPIIVSPERTQP